MKGMGKERKGNAARSKGKGEGKRMEKGTNRALGQRRLRVSTS